MILSLGELNTIVNKFGTEEEHGKLEVIKNEIKPHYEDDLEEKEFLKTLVAKVTVDQHENMKVECISDFVNEDQCNFDFNHSISEAIESINHSIIEAHKEVMNEEVENKANHQEINTGQQDEISSKETEQDEDTTATNKQEARRMARMVYMQQMER
ncbi:hypothetical protein P4V61_24820 [Bacillus thuringiensis]|nr:hypothetical protein BG10_1731 [Bacillus thuringiensis serovar morrisoni]MEE2015180.1 hypothetical protein [Bacillus thuringiensis]